MSTEPENNQGTPPKATTKTAAPVKKAAPKTAARPKKAAAKPAEEKPVVFPSRRVWPD